MSLSLITDRTAADVAYYSGQLAKIMGNGWSTLTVAEQAEWISASLKGGYWHTDLNRVGSAIQYLAGLLTNYGYPITVSARTNWTLEDDNRATSMQAYIADITNLKNRFYGTTTLPGTMDNLNYISANNIEVLLLEIEGYINGMAAEIRFCGYFSCGE